jgi:hypothetical protein
MPKPCQYLLPISKQEQKSIQLIVVRVFSRNVYRGGRLWCAHITHTELLHKPTFARMTVSCVKASWAASRATTAFCFSCWRATRSLRRVWREWFLSSLRAWLRCKYFAAGIYIFGEAPLVGAWALSVDSFPPHFTQASLGPPRPLHGLKLDIGSLTRTSPCHIKYGTLGCGVWRCRATFCFGGGQTSSPGPPRALPGVRLDIDS